MLTTKWFLFLFFSYFFGTDWKFIARKNPKYNQPGRANATQVESRTFSFNFQSSMTMYFITKLLGHKINQTVVSVIGMDFIQTSIIHDNTCKLTHKELSLESYQSDTKHCMKLNTIFSVARNGDGNLLTTCVSLMVRDDPKLPDDSGGISKLNGVVGSSIPGCEIISLLDRKLTRCSSTSCILEGKKTYIRVYEVNLHKAIFSRSLFFWT